MPADDCEHAGSGECKDVSACGRKGVPADDCEHAVSGTCKYAS